ncbi:hypothetical protein [Motilimonas sp. E26]|uniref:hypothetical protein n=1 Tax=Motilimonas sp. E26 TaxID=2865674 RepID=UPI001E2CC675|nr:hypothetical protein [Motilimonas sp. E26]MCE0557566.1 hypothetical protein [Motilimonas sp. E26]
MSQNQVLPDEKKLTVLCRVEPGCLGPDGKNYIEEFCRFAEQEFTEIDRDFVHWLIVPRYDKSLPETQYQLAAKNLTYQQACKYLALFGKELDEFESHLNEKLAELIDQHLGR